MRSDACGERDEKELIFNNVTVDGFFAGQNGEIDWFKVDKDYEFDEFSREQSKSG